MVNLQQDGGRILITSKRKKPVNNRVFTGSKKSDKQVKNKSVKNKNKSLRDKKAVLLLYTKLNPSW